MTNRLTRWVAIHSITLPLLACSPTPAQQAVPAPSPDSYTTIERRIGIGSSEQEMKGAEVSPGFFGATAPVIGRFFVTGDFQPVSSRVVVLHHEFWKGRFAGSPAVIGTQIQIERLPFTIVGVAPPGFNSPDAASFWIPRQSQ